VAGDGCSGAGLRVSAESDASGVREQIRYYGVAVVAVVMLAMDNFDVLKHHIVRNE